MDRATSIEKLDNVPLWPWHRRPTRGLSCAMKHHKMTQSVGIETLEPPTSKDAAIGSPYLPHGGHKAKKLRVRQTIPGPHDPISGGRTG